MNYLVLVFVAGFALLAACEPDNNGDGDGGGGGGSGSGGRGGDSGDGGSVLT